jgi:hypothetical protein
MRKKPGLNHAGRAVDAPQQLLARRLGEVREADQVLGRGLVRIGLRHRQHGLRVGAEVAREALEEAHLLGLGQGAEARDELACDGHAVGFAALGKQALAVEHQAAQLAVVAHAAGGTLQTIKHVGSPGWSRSGLRARAAP